MDDRESFYEYIDRIKQIDQLLEAPSESLIALTERALEDRNQDPLRDVVLLPLYFPPWVADDREFPRGKLSITSATCCATLQRLWRRRRRFPRLEKKIERLGKKIREAQDSDRSLPDLVARGFLPPRGGKGDQAYLTFLKETDLLGRQRPLPASEMLWTLINAGEGVAYSGAGFLSFFAIVWSLRYSADRFSAGASIGLAPPTSYITARCLLPIHALTQACIQRADLLTSLIEILRDMSDLMKKDARARSREFPFKLDKLTTVLYDYAEMTLARRSFRSCAQDLERWAGSMSAQFDVDEQWRRVRERLQKAIREAGETGKLVVAEASPVAGSSEPEAGAGPEGKTESILRRICRAIEGQIDEKADETALANLSVKVPQPRFPTTQARRRFWEAHSKAANETLEICELAFRALQDTSEGLARLDSSEIPAIQERLRDLTEANRKVAAAIEEQILDSVQWCEAVMHREISHASAGNLTELDPAELVSGLGVAVTFRRIDSPLRLADAVNKALKGARDDGSWIPGQPFALDESSGLGESAPTAAIVWMLSGTIARHRAVTAADQALGRYVDWLEATKRTLLVPERPDSKREPLRVTGWTSERTVRADRIDLWLTAFAINSLLNIRGLMEFRLWQICKQRFTILQGGRSLSELDAVDLGARQEYRLHRRLTQMARRAEGDDYAEADYAVVLHGPPGSSKTVIAQAVSKEMWRGPQRLAGGEPRLVRITPADFTRGGEDRLDSEARVIFDLLSHVRNVTILFDEIDDLLRERNPREPPSFLKLVVPAMLNRLQDLRDACARQEIFFLLATNYIERIEPALIRKGRIDYAIPLVYPDVESRLAILERQVAALRAGVSGWAGDFLEAELCGGQIGRTDFWPWMAITSLCKEVSKDLRVFAPAWEQATSAQDKQQVEERARERLNGLVELLGASLSEIPYRTRLKDNESSAELREEFLWYMFAAARDLADYSSKLSARLSEESFLERILTRGDRLWRGQGRLQEASPSARQ
jgi:hypothetical protein